MAVNNGDSAQKATVTGGANDYQIGGNHYRSAIQHWDYVLANEIPYLEAQAIKYLTRWRRKGAHQDLKKAQHVLKKIFENQGLDWYTGDHIVNQAEGLCAAAQQQRGYSPREYPEKTYGPSPDYGSSVAAGSTYKR